MALFRKSEVTVLKDTTAFDAEIGELEELKARAKGALVSKIDNQIELLKKGSKGEDEIMFQLKYSGVDMIVLRDLYIECNDLSAQIDYYVVTPYLHFVIECKNLTGNITIDENGSFIRTYGHGKDVVKEGIPSPITQNERHLLVLKNLRIENAGKLSRLILDKSFSNFTRPLVVLANSKTILNDKFAPKEIKNKVVRADNLANVLKAEISKCKEEPSSRKQMQQQAEYVLSFHKENQTDYVKRFREMVEEQEEKERKKHTICPECGGKLVKRHGRFGEFYGCSNYPKCKYTKQIKHNSN